MEQSEQIRLLERALKHIDGKTSDREDVYSVPAAFYNDPVQLKRERETLFHRHPLVAGFASQVAKPGDYFVFDFNEHSFLITRAEDGRLHALANFCRHRGTRLVEGAGQSRRFVCPYHAWSYAADGRLLNVPHRENFPHLDDCALPAYPVAEKYGLIWVRPELGGSAIEPARDLGTFAPDLASFGFDTHVRFAPKAFRSPINWKLMLEASLETYHFKYTHARTIAPMFFDDLGVFDWSAPHARMFLPKQSIKDLRAQDPAQWAIRPHGNLIYFFFPNTVLLVQPDHATWMSSFPIDERSCWINGGTLIPERPDTEKAEKYWQKNVDIFWQAIEEDYAMSEKIQLGLNSGQVPNVLFGRSELLVRHFHDAIREASR